MNQKNYAKNKKYVFQPNPKVRRETSMHTYLNRTKVADLHYGKDREMDVRRS